MGLNDGPSAGWQLPGPPVRNGLLATSNWSSVSAGLENAGSVYALAVSGSNLFAGTWVGSVFLSTDNGSSWTTVSTGLVNPGPLRSFAFAGTILYVGTTNNGVWRRPLSDMISTSVTMLDSNIPSAFALGQNYPNPFNPATMIRYSLPHRSHVSLTVINTLGQKVVELVSGDVEAGNHEVQFNANNLASGVYFYRLQAGKFVQAKSLIVVK